MLSYSRSDLGTYIVILDCEHPCATGRHGTLQTLSFKPSPLPLPLLFLLLLHGPHGIFNLSRVIPDLAVEKWVSPVGRLRGLDPFLSLIRARLQDYKVQGISAIVGKQPRPNVIISAEKDELPERKRLFWQPTKSAGALTTHADHIPWTPDFLLHTVLANHS